MRALIADDDHVSALVVARAVERRWQVPVEVVHDGDAAWAALNAGTPPSLAIVDWMMPGMDGLELCRRIRKSPACAQMYVILLTARDSRADIVDSAELGARVQAGIRILSLQSQLNARIGELQQTLAAVRQLKGLLPICCYCKRIRKDEDYWQQLETYISDHSDAEFSHGICPECLVNARVEFEA